MGEWEIVAADGTKYRDSGRAAVGALLAADKVAGTDMLLELQDNSSMTVMEYLDKTGHEKVGVSEPPPPASPKPALPPVMLAPPAPVPPVRPGAAATVKDAGIPSSWWIAGAVAVVLMPLLVYGGIAAFAPSPEVAVEPADSPATATPAARPEREARSTSARDGETRDRPSPVAVGEEHDVEIISVGGRGDGMAKIEGLSVFVPGTKKGDNVRVRITRIGPRSAQAEVVR